METSVDVNYSSPLSQYLVSIIERKFELSHHETAEDGWTSRHPSLAMHQHIFFIFNGLCNKGLRFLEKWRYFLVFAVLDLNVQVLSFKTELSNTLFYLLLLVRFFVHDCDDGSYTFFVDTLTADRLFSSKINVPRSIKLILQSLVILYGVLGLKDEV